MTPRETIEITTPIGKQVVVLKGYISAREQRLINDIVMKGMKDMNISLAEQKLAVPQIDPAVLDKAEEQAFKLIIVSIDGHKDGDVVDGKPFSVADSVLEMRIQDYQRIKKEVDDITQDKQTEALKKILGMNAKGS